MQVTRLRVLLTRIGIHQYTVEIDLNRLFVDYFLSIWPDVEQIQIHLLLLQEAATVLLDPPRPLDNLLLSTLPLPNVLLRH